MNKKIDINYSREAFMHPANLVCLFGATMAAFLFKDIGLTANVILSITFGLEMIYLGVIPGLSTFRRSVQLRKKEKENGESGDRDAFHQLDTRSQKRFLILKHITKEVKQNFDKLPYASQGMLDHIQKKLEGLLSTYLILLDMHKKYKVYVNSEVEEELKNEVEKEEKAMDGLNSETLKKTRQRRIQILNKRLKKFGSAKEKFLICETHLETIEDAIRYIYEQSITMPNAEDVGNQLDHLLSEMEETTTLIGEMDDTLLPGFESLDQELELAQMRKEADELHKTTELKAQKTKS